MQQPQQQVSVPGGQPPIAGLVGGGDYVPGESKTLWMGGVQPNWDETFLSTLFPSPNGELVTVKVMRHPQSNLPLGYAFVDFSSHDAALNALNSLNGQPIPGTNLLYRLNWGAGGRKPFGSLQEFSIFVGDLGPEVTDAMLQEAFAARYPSCSSAKVVTDAASGVSKGYGFVRFTDKTHCDEALQTMNGTLVGSRPVRVSPATARRQDRHLMGSPQHMSAGLGYMPGLMRGNSWVGNARSPQGLDMLQHQQMLASSVVAAGTSEPNHDGSVPLSETSSTASTLSPPQSENTTVFVGNLDPSVTEEQLLNHFQGFGNIIQVKIPPNRGCGFVKYDSRESAEKALTALHGSILAGLRIRLDWGKANASGRRFSGMAMASMDPSLGYPMQAQQYYYAQWQAQQAQAAYYYRYSAQAPVYMVPQQGYTTTGGVASRQQGGYVAATVQYPHSPILTPLDGTISSVDFTQQTQSLMPQPNTTGMWNEAVQ